MKRVILVHHHIFKNAGTSFNYALKQFYGDRFIEYDLPGGQVVTSEHLAELIQNHPEAAAISGHHIAMPAPQADQFSTISSVLIRKPLARVRSIYEFERKQQAQTDGAIMAKELDFKEFVLWRLEHAPIVFCDYQTHYCSRIKNGAPKYRPTQEKLELAVQNLEQALIVGTVERYNETLSLAQSCLSQYYPDISLESARLNTTTQTPISDAEIQQSLVADLGEALVNQLAEMNQLDEQLYQATDAILTQRLKAQLLTVIEG